MPPPDGEHVADRQRARYLQPDAPLTQADLDVDSAYNLRRFRGLPPGPIANPSLSSIKAALHPEASPYFYYLHGTDGADPIPHHRRAAVLSGAASRTRLTLVRQRR